MNTMQYRPVVILTAVLSVSLAAVSLFGSFIPWTYAREVPSMAAQGTGQDLVNLFIILPVLIGSLAGVLRGKFPARFVFTGTLLYILYSFVIYSFGVHFNRLFLLYCLTLGISFYLFIIMITRMLISDAEVRFPGPVPVRFTSVFFIVVAAMFYLLWLRDVVPAILDDTIPDTVSDYDLLVNPVHVMDMAVALPALILTGVSLLKKGRLGLVLAPVMLIFLIELAVALAGMVLMVQKRGIDDSGSVAGVFLVLAVVSGLILFFFMRGMKPAAVK